MKPDHQKNARAEVTGLDTNDNSYSEAQFKTTKYRPDFSDRCGSLDVARQWMRQFVRWYNHDHCHSGIGLLPPAVVHRGQASAAVAARQQVLAAAYAAHPERFGRGMPYPPHVPEAVWINRPRGPDDSSVFAAKGRIPFATSP